MTSLKLASFTLVALGICSATLTGCGSFQTSAPIAVQGTALHGVLHGGQQPISGSTLQLYAAGSTGYGSAYAYSSGVSLLGTHNVQTDVTGSFAITGDYTCPTPTTEVYLVATGGSPAPSSPANSSIALMAALGPCGQLSASTFISMNEVTTVAAVWALSPFMTGIANIGTSAANPQGLINAFATVNKLSNFSTGAVGGPALPAGATLPVAKINTLADMLAFCINSAGNTGIGNACDVLFTAATVNGVKPADTLTAAMNLAQNSGLGTSLATMVGPTPPFQPTLTSAPNDFSLVITYSGGGLSTPKGIAADASGNVWVANAGNNSLSKLDALGVTPTDATGFLSGAGGYTIGSLSAATSMAIDLSGNAWVANGNNTVSEVSANGSSGAVFTGGNLSLPASIAVDGSNNVWVANRGNSSVTQITPGATTVLNNYAGAGISAPGYIAVAHK